MELRRQPERSLQRRDLVLQVWRDDGLIAPEVFEAAVARLEPLGRDAAFLGRQAGDPGSRFAVAQRQTGLVR